MNEVELIINPYISPIYITNTHLIYSINIITINDVQQLAKILIEITINILSIFR
jgi:hypothetical protein